MSLLGLHERSSPKQAGARSKQTGARNAYKATIYDQKLRAGAAVQLLKS
jgi:hypothetical protein